MSEIFNFSVEKDNSNTRLDLFLQKQFPDFSRNKIKMIIEKNNVTINNKIPTKSGVIVKENDKISIEIEDNIPLDAKPENIPLNIVFEDGDLAVINKPQGMVVHAGNGNYDKTLVNALLFHIKDLSGINGVLRPGIVHRLDKNTAGLLLVAKNDTSHKDLAKQIETKTCKRTYVAILDGNVKNDSGIIETYITRNPKNRTTMCVTQNQTNAKIAITEYKVLERFPNYSYVEFNLKTGRTHQIRVHSKEVLHCPIANDIEYGGHTPKVLYKKDEKSLGQYLVAKQIQFTHPTTKQQMNFEIDLPNYFQILLKRLREIKK